MDILTRVNELKGCLTDEAIDLVDTMIEKPSPENVKAVLYEVDTLRGTLEFNLLGSNDKSEIKRYGDMRILEYLVSLFPSPFRPF